MKKLLLPLFAAIALSACNSNPQPDSTEENDSISAQIENTDKEKAEEGAFSLKTESYSEHRIFQLGDRKLYHENEIYIEWPVSATGIDLEALQDALRKAFSIDNKDIQKYVNEWAMNTTADDGFDGDRTLVKEKDTSRDEQAYDDSDDETIYPMYDTECSTRIKYEGIDSIHNTLSFERFFVENNGCGLGSCIYPFYDYLTFDIVNNKAITLKDIIANEKLAVKELKKQRIGSEDYGGLEGLDEIAELPKDFFIKDDCVFVVFTKYEISYGADGCPMLGFDVKKCPQMLTDYGKKLFGIDMFKK